MGVRVPPSLPGRARSEAHEPRLEDGLPDLHGALPWTWVGMLDTGPLGGVGRGMTDGACGAPSASRDEARDSGRSARIDEHGGRGGCESSACGADRIRWRGVRWEVAFAEGAYGALPHRKRESGWDSCYGSHDISGPAPDGAERLSDTQRDTPRSVTLDRRVAIESR
jgi:hypothetical protein